MLAAVYEVPHLAHATAEPLSCVADVRSDSCEVWAPTQDPAGARSRIRSETRLPDEAITVHIPIIGGGFGRRLQADYVEEAVEISANIGEPIKLVWTREDDIQHGYYHPMSVHYVRGSLTDPGLPWVTSRTDSLIPNGPWRSVTNFTDAFVRECFLDEMAVALGRDPLELRLEIEPPSLHPVLEKAASEAGWGSDLPQGWGRGIACHSTWNATPVALVAEVSVSSDAQVRVHKVVCAVNCGLVINPNMVEEQMEGGIVFGLSAALKGSITFENGRAQQSNFHDYPILSISEMPVVETHILPSEYPPSGVGEMSIPAIAPAVFNAVYAATGKRVRHMPLRSSDLLDE
jgi:isoquinoline 1-oxidoreductase beta subunit